MAAAGAAAGGAGAASSSSATAAAAAAAATAAATAPGAGGSAGGSHVAGGGGAFSSSVPVVVAVVVAAVTALLYVRVLAGGDPGSATPHPPPSGASPGQGRGVERSRQGGGGDGDDGDGNDDDDRSTVSSAAATTGAGSGVGGEGLPLGLEDDDDDDDDEEGRVDEGRGRRSGAAAAAAAALRRRGVAPASPHQLASSAPSSPARAGPSTRRRARSRSPVGPGRPPERLNESVGDPLGSLWGRRVAQTPLYNDVPRLARRTTLRRDGALVVDGDATAAAAEAAAEAQGPIPTGPAAAAAVQARSEASSRGTRVVVADLVAALLAFFGEGGSPQLDAALDAYRSGPPSSDLGPSTRELFAAVQEHASTETAASSGGARVPDDAAAAAAAAASDGFDSDARTLQLLKLLHQSAVMAPATILKREVAQQTTCFLKDVRERSGWTISIELDTRARTATVTHRRQEISASVGAIPDFTVDWQLQAVVAAQNMTLASQRVVLNSVVFADADLPHAAREPFEDVLRELFS